ncbi:chromosomal replication initiator protein DnaA [Algoriphagus sp. NF]|jgi:chromosomal replication initiator protein|uniref:Chromosomal replication initiator protein DnaA n=2 Tax=Algoriphagus TaxID=246875 RepID=A0ABS7NBY6_9BACT|nr:MULTISPECIES: chromosomal replication initiator protein DnaA [Algoriphagus]MBY5952700.1 chromosomal replication initiator protein DnaA [Algoriphagus marincola]MDE0559115.1 chromosomal replication initiator protein DnaA [Algoriphagus sp. NF]TDK48833.1 chromosomal replication initiator protein DnaA [Algoriphagus aquimaris]
MSSEASAVWNECLRVIEQHVSEQSFSTWFKPINPVKLEGTSLTIQVPSQFFYEWLEDNYIQELKLAIKTILGQGGRLEYAVVVDRGNSSNQPYMVSYPQGNHGAKKVPVGSNGKDESQRSPFQMDSLGDEMLTQSNLNPTYTFSTYIEGDCNRLARSAGFAVATKPGITSFNPLMVYGGVGLGKTHLVQAIGNEIKNGPEDKFVLYVSSEKFVNQFMDSIKDGNVKSFTNFYMQVDVLIIDDIQFLAGKDRTQEMFFHIFNHLHQSKKQIIMTSDCPPRDLKGLEERLLSRFKWGLTADLQMPDFETRVAIIRRKMQSEGIFIPDDVVEYLAYTVDTNVRELEGILISLIAHASLNRVDIDLQLAKTVMKNIIKDIETEVGIDFIQKTVSEYFGIALDDLKAKTRKKEIVIARQVAMYFSKEFTNHSLKSIGYHFGGRDHSTVIHALTTVNDMIDTDNQFKNSINELKKKFKMRSY